MLFNGGFGQPDAMGGRIQAWRNLFDLFSPDLLYTDFSPTALLASRGLGLPRVAAGLGYLFPTRTDPAPPILYWETPDPEILRRDEARLLDAVNAASAPLGVPRTESVTDLTHGELNLIQTIPELDPHHPRRTLGPTEAYRADRLHDPTGLPPVWPPGSGKRIFTYLKPSPQTPSLLEAIRDSGQPALVFAPEMPLDRQRLFASKSLRFSPEPLDLRQVAEQCDLAAMPATHGSVLNMMAAGIPMFLTVDNIDQAATARKVVEAGVGLAWPLSETDGVRDLSLGLSRMIGEDQWAGNAAALGKKIRDRGVVDSAGERADEIEGLILR